MPSIYVAIADDEALFRKGLSLLLEEDPEISVIIDAGNGQELLDALTTAERLPKVLLLDLKMPVLDGIETAKILKNDYPEINFIVLSTHFSKAFIVNMIELGAAGYLPKNSEPTEVIQTIRAVHEKGFYYNTTVLEVVREYMLTKKIPKLGTLHEEPLTSREQEILQLICEQYTSSEIAEKLFISRRTVEGHRNNLLLKLGCRNVAGLVVYALQHDLVQIDPSTKW